MTAKLEEIALDYIGRIDKMGGMVEAIEAGYPQKEIQESAYWYQKAVEKKEKIIVGVNEFEISEEAPIEILKVDEAVEKKQIEALKKLRKERNNREVKSALEKLKETAKGTDNLMYPIIDAVKAYATLGEICDVLREVFGEYMEPVFF